MKGRPFVTAIILAAGSGSRMSCDITKQKMTICGESILHRTVRIFASCDEIDDIIIATRADEVDWVKDEIKDITKPISVIVGGKSRAESSFNAYTVVSPKTDFVAIHDGARCLVTKADIEAVVRAAYEYGCATAGTKITDTVKKRKNEFIEYTIPRDSLFAAHTPQVFSKAIFDKALNNKANIFDCTDDNMLVEHIGEKIYTVETGKQNIKITTPEDIEYAEYIIKRREAMREIRVGHGYDVHRIVANRKLVLGGVEIPYDKGLLGHSDADVVTHAIMDAMLGACALGDIGRHFPDNSDEYKDISSLTLLKRVKDLVFKSGYEVVNIDATIVLQRPKIAPYVDQMIENISQILDLEYGRINIKATTTEGLGFTGREEGACAHAVVTVKNKG